MSSSIAANGRYNNMLCIGSSHTCGGSSDSAHPDQDRSFIPFDDIYKSIDVASPKFHFWPILDVHLRFFTKSFHEVFELTAYMVALINNTLKLQRCEVHLYKWVQNVKNKAKLMLEPNIYTGLELRQLGFILRLNFEIWASYYWNMLATDCVSFVN